MNVTSSRVGDICYIVRPQITNTNIEVENCAEENGFAREIGNWENV